MRRPAPESPAGASTPRTVQYSCRRPAGERAMDGKHFDGSASSPVPSSPSFSFPAVSAHRRATARACPRAARRRRRLRCRRRSRRPDDDEEGGDDDGDDDGNDELGLWRSSSLLVRGRQKPTQDDGPVPRSLPPCGRRRRRRCRRRRRRRLRPRDEAARKSTGGFSALSASGGRPRSAASGPSKISSGRTANPGEAVG